MSLLDALISALDALRKHKLRSALTMLGIIIGVAAVIAMVAVGGGAREQVLAQIRNLGTNLLVIWSQPISQSRVRLGAGAVSTLVYEDAVAIAKEIPAVQVVAPILYGNTLIVAGNANWTTSITGVELSWFEARNWDVELGRIFEPEEISFGAQVALLGQTVARKLFGDLDPIGQDVRVRNVAAPRRRRDGRQGSINRGAGPGRRRVPAAQYRASARAWPHSGQRPRGQPNLRQGARARESCRS